MDKNLKVQKFQNINAKINQAEVNKIKPKRGNTVFYGISTSHK